jgi:hypothetical protein
MKTRHINQGILVACIAAAALSVGACEKEGPVERMGEEIDEAGEDIRAGEERLDNKLDDAADELKE